jgi:PelA/Pel-15E family pectate lyase
LRYADEAKTIAGMKLPGILRHRAAVIVATLLPSTFSVLSVAAEPPLADQAVAAMRKAAAYYRTIAAVRGGYVYYYSPDLSRRLGEGKAGPQEIWVQAPGTPTVGLAYLRAHAVTGDAFYLEAAREAAEALVYGQLASGGWQASIDFDPSGPRVQRYRNGKGRGDRNNSSLDDGITQNALRFLMHTDRALGFKHAAIHEAVEFARAALLAAQFPSGGFPQVWTKPVAAHPPVKASFPDYDWRTENRIKEYWDLPTLNDDLTSDVTRTLLDAAEIYREAKCRTAAVKLGDFLLLAQMPEPQPGWAQQYDTKMRPVWARKFEPPAMASRESMDAMAALLRIHGLTGDAKYLDPLPRALAWLKRSRLPDGKFARYYELKSNQPLYMTRDYQLTHDDSQLPEHYGWKVESRLEAIEAALAAAKARQPAPATPAATDADIRQIVQALDAEGRWISKFGGEMMVGQPKFQTGDPYLASAVFAKNLETLSDYLLRTRPGASSLRK